MGDMPWLLPNVARLILEIEEKGGAAMDDSVKEKVGNDGEDALKYLQICLNVMPTQLEKRTVSDIVRRQREQWQQGARTPPRTSAAVMNVATYVF